MESYKQFFSRCLEAVPGRLHFAAHSHHLWPDVSLTGQVRAWEDAARLVDRKWSVVLGEVYTEAQAHVARILDLPDPATVVFAPNTHELVMRILSAWDGPIDVLTTDGEFHSFRRQSRRLEEAGRARVERVPVEPFATFGERFAEAAAGWQGHLVYVSQVFYDSGFVVPGLTEIVEAVPDPETVVIVDGYHGFMARPTDLAAIAGRAFYLGGGYKYAMSGEGVCFAHCPPGYVPHPVDTGWFAGFDELEASDAGRPVSYPDDGRRLLGGTLDPTGLYRFCAVMGWLLDLGVTVDDIHRRVVARQQEFLARLEEDGSPLLAALVPDRSVVERGNFLIFRLPEAPALFEALDEAGVITDLRGDRLRIGFGLYHDPEDVDELARRLRQVVATVSR
jgi:selenocysteine lyase/cysteine desulfurase